MPHRQALLKIAHLDAEAEQLRAALAEALAQRDSALWALRVVRRDIEWYEDSPTLRIVEQVLAGAPAPRPRSLVGA